MICYERADDIGFGVSGVVTRARGIRATLPDLDPGRDSHGGAGHAEKVVYLLDPHRRQPPLRRAARWPTRYSRARHLHRDYAVELPYIPPFLHKRAAW